jgi:hypothetical protein
MNLHLPTLLAMKAFFDNNSKENSYIKLCEWIIEAERKSDTTVKPINPEDDCA